MMRWPLLALHDAPECSSMVAGLRRMDEFFDRLATALAPLVTQDPGSTWIDQSCSPLGRNRHCAIVRRRIDEAQPGTDCGAYRIGRRHLLSVAALREEMRRLAIPLRKTEAPEPDHAAQLRAKLRGVR